VVVSLQRCGDEELIARARSAPAVEAEACLEHLFRRHYPKVAGWCLAICRDRDEAADLAQEVFLRVHDRLHSFRGQSRFSTWLYTVTRRVAINRGIAAQRRQVERLAEVEVPELVDPAPGAADAAERGEIAARLRQAMERDLEPTEARVLYLHYVDGLKLAAITSLMDLRNKSGAKAFVVSGRRKLERRFGRWLARQTPEVAGPHR
jgi:RNA polymerase sigma-70 factor, ECF subfamily